MAEHPQVMSGSVPLHLGGGPAFAASSLGCALVNMGRSAWLLSHSQLVVIPGVIDMKPVQLWSTGMF